MDILRFSGKFVVTAKDAYGSVLWLSDDGANWPDTIQFPQSNAGAMCTFGSNLYVATIDGLLQVDTDFNGNVVFDESISLMIVYGSYLYLVSKFKIYRTNNGSLFTLVEEFSSSDFLYINCLCVHGGSLFFGTDNGKIYSTPDGTTYSLEATVVADKSVRILISVGGYLYASLFGSGIYRSADGTLWNLINSTNMRLLINCNNAITGLNSISVAGAKIGLASYRLESQDQILLASAARHGLMGMTQAARLNSIASNATQDRWNITGVYTGNGAASNYVSLGFQPGYVRIKDYATNGSQWEGIQGATFCFRHMGATAAALKHTRQVASLTIKATTLGFKTFSVAGLNVSSRQYHYIAIKESI